MEMLCFKSYKKHRVRNVVSAVLVYPSISRGRVSVDPWDMTTLFLVRLCLTRIHL